MIKDYYYNQQLKKALIVFANIFTNLKVRTGKNACGDIDEILVPIHYGSSDRVAAAIATGHTSNRLHTLPIMSCYMTGIEPAPDRKHGHGLVDRKSFLEQGGIFPKDVKFIRRIVPTPYNLSFELSIYASNTDQAYQIIEQIMIVFDYEVQVQFNDTPFDWAKVTRVILDTIGNEENYPAGTERRMIVWNLGFTFETWITPPAEIRHDLIAAINLQFANLDDYDMQEVDDDGNLVPFAPEQSFGSVTISEDPTQASDEEVNIKIEHYDPSMDPECHVQPIKN